MPVPLVLESYRTRGMRQRKMRLRIFAAAAFATVMAAAVISARADGIRKTVLDLGILGLGASAGAGMYMLERPRTQKQALINVFVFSK